MTQSFVYILAIWVCVSACGGDSEQAGDGGYLGSLITPNPAGGPGECTNYYEGGAVTAAQMKALMATFNRTEPCPVKDSIGACELPLSASGGLKTQNEMVYYRGYSSSGTPIEDPEYANLRDGDVCNTRGVWQKPYTASKPPRVPEPTDGARDLGAAGTKSPTTVAAPNRGDLLGPESDDEAPIVIGKDYWTPDNRGNSPLDDVLVADAAGNVYTMLASAAASTQSDIQKFDADLRPVSTITFSTLFPEVNGPHGIGGFTDQGSSVAADGSVIVAGSTSDGAALTDEASAGGIDALIAKLKPDGTVDWIHQWGLAGDETPYLSTTAPDGAVIVEGQTDQKDRWLVRYEADGKLAWGQKYNLGKDDVFTQLLVDGQSNIYVIATTHVIKFDKAGKELGRFTPARNQNDDLFDSYFVMILDPKNAGFYSWAPMFRMESHTTGYALAQYDFDLNVQWYRPTEITRTAGTWTGAFHQPAPVYGNTLAISDNAIYIAGRYDNKRVPAAGQLTLTDTVFVGRYDLNGERVWFRQFAFDGMPANSDLIRLHGIVLDHRGNPIVAAWAAVAGTSAGFLFKLKAEDGSVF